MPSTVHQLQSSPGEQIEQIPLAKMIKDDRAQRPFDLAWGRSLAKSFDRRLLGVLTVAYDPDADTYLVIDGWHRRYALSQCGFTHAPCIVHRNLSLSDQAARFVGLNRRRNVAYFDGYHARVTAGDPIAIAIDNAVREAGWRVSRKALDGHLMAVQSLEQLYQRTRRPPTPEGDITLIHTLLRVVTTAWGYDPDAVSGRILAGIGLVLLQYGDAVDHGVLARKLAKYPGGAAGLIGKARSLRETYRSSMANAIAEITVHVYNHNRRTNALPDWRRRH